MPEVPPPRRPGEWTVETSPAAVSAVRRGLGPSGLGLIAVAVVWAIPFVIAHVYEYLAVKGRIELKAP